MRENDAATRVARIENANQRGRPFLRTTKTRMMSVVAFSLCRHHMRYARKSTLRRRRGGDCIFIDKEEKRVPRLCAQKPDAVVKGIVT